MTKIKTNKRQMSKMVGPYFRAHKHPKQNRAEHNEKAITNATKGNKNNTGSCYIKIKFWTTTYKLNKSHPRAGSGCALSPIHIPATSHECVMQNCYPNGEGFAEMFV